MVAEAANIVEYRRADSWSLQRRPPGNVVATGLADKSQHFAHGVKAGLRENPPPPQPLLEVVRRIAV